MGTREARQEAKRELVLDRAGRLFYDRGYESTAMKDIAEACDLGMNAIYSVFSSKEAICAELFLQAQQGFASDFKEILASEGTLPVKNRALMNRYIDFYSRHNFLYEIVWLVLNGQLQAHINFDTVTVIHAIFIDLLESYQLYLEKLERQAVIAPEDDLKKLSSTFWCMISGLASNYVHKTGEITGISNRDIRELELDMVLKVLKYDPGREEALR